MSFPSPPTQRLVRHLGQWGTDPLGLLQTGAELGQVFSLQLWRNVIVGHSSEWNRLVLGDVELFRSRGSMSGLSPYLAGGLVQTDAPQHRARRQELNPTFHRRMLLNLVPTIADIVQNSMPEAVFDVGDWTSSITRKLLSAIFFEDLLPTRLLTRFLTPLDKSLPAPFLPRPLLFHSMNYHLRWVIDACSPAALASAFGSLDNGVDELRVALSAGYDTTAHTLGWLLWHLAENSNWAQPSSVRSFVNETLRLYPAGWVGSRICSKQVQFGQTLIPAGTMVLYSPYLTHRDAGTWAEPLEFRPARFSEALPAWGFIPFAAGERTCLGMHLAVMVLQTVIEQFATASLERVAGNTELRAGITLSPRGRLLMRIQ